MAEATPPILDLDWCAALPKVELHVHLEGALPLEGLWALLERHGGDPHVPDRAALRERLRYRDFRHFLEVWSWKNRFLRTTDDFRLLAGAVARHLAAQGHVHVEAFCSPPDFASTGLSTREIVAALRQGLDEEPRLRVALVVDLVRDAGAERALDTVEEAAACRDLGVVGIGLGGSEADFPARDFRAAFERARALGLRTSCHAGEGDGPRSVWEALDVLGADRIGHAVRAVEDPLLVAELERRQTPLEMCPLSNVRTGVWPALEDHPALAWLRRGLVVSLHTDDPALFHTSLAGEFAAQRALGAERAEIQAFLAHAARSCWLPLREREELERKMDAACGREDLP